MLRIVTVVLLLAGAWLIMDNKYVEGELSIIIGILFDIASAIGGVIRGMYHIIKMLEVIYFEE